MTSSFFSEGLYVYLILNASPQKATVTITAAGSLMAGSGRLLPLSGKSTLPRTCRIDDWVQSLDLPLSQNEVQRIAMTVTDHVDLRCEATPGSSKPLPGEPQSEDRQHQIQAPAGCDVTGLPDGRLNTLCEPETDIQILFSLKFGQVALELCH